MKTAFLILALLPSVAFTQNYSKTVHTDSSKYYQQETKKVYKQTLDSLQSTALFTGYREYQKRNNNYYSFVLFCPVVHTDYSSFNSSIAASGFTAMKALSAGFGIGMSTKTGHAIIDFYAASVAAQTTKKRYEEIGSSLSNLFQFDLGYDVLHSHVVSVYPYLGLSLRAASLYYKKTGTINSNYTNISDLITNGTNIQGSSVRLGYQAGAGADFTLHSSKQGDGVVLFFIKGGLNQPFAKDVYKIEQQKYDPAINKGDLVFWIGFKFGSRLGQN